jgi:hypothetical protein
MSVLGTAQAVAPTRRIRAMASEAIRDRIAYRPISTDPSQAEGNGIQFPGEHEATNGDVSLQARVPARVYLP